MKWVPVLFLALAALAARLRGDPRAGGGRGDRRRRRSGRHPALRPRLAAGLEPLAENAVRVRRATPLPSRLEQLGLPHAVSIGLAAAAAAGAAWIARDARAGCRATAAPRVFVLATTPYLAVWYLAWAVLLAAVDEDRVARVAALALRRTSRPRRSRSGATSDAYERLSRSTRMLSSSKTVSKRPLARSSARARRNRCGAMLSSR